MSFVSLLTSSSLSTSLFHFPYLYFFHSSNSIAISSTIPFHCFLLYFIFRFLCSWWCLPIFFVAFYRSIVS